ncbi:GNAT family N-acetyltransferase [Streptomyces cinnabarinus]|uniref:GNAT family N-acetyltransferase n=1 Tax=Streptomyces cinnabarinus TaxID=67287 RepID=A0ABY7KG06_9ACTN|nr:GNAT family N-acetyltransferase [Streptomyces cinnabarinus]WAZ21829.1 GNAT family N-acetyltransferase [Streptomyces cinnabarinus]
MTKAIFLTLSRGGDELLDVGFRTATDADTDAVVALSEPFVADGSLISRTRETYAADIAEFFVLDIEGEIVACAGAGRGGALAEIYNFAVHEKWHGHGLGHVLLGSVIAALHQEQVEQVVLFSGTTVRWFERHGFERVEESELPAERVARIDRERGSVPLRRSTLRGFDAPDVLARIAGLKVRFERSGVELGWDGTFDSLLQFADHHGIETDSRCWAGACGTCRTFLKKGTVNYHTEPGADLEGQEMLLCQAQPVTDLVLDL